MNDLFKYLPAQPKNDEVINSYYILSSIHDSSNSFYALFERVRKERKAIGTPTDEEQDLLRAMFLFASSGLDSMVKQLVLDALTEVIHCDEGAHSLFVAHLEKRLQRGEAADYKILAKALSSTHPKICMIDDLVYSLRANSLQSKDQLLKVAAHFNIPSNALVSDFKLLEKIFEARNQIAHEMDVNLGQKNRSRRSRKKDDLWDYTQEILRICGVFIMEVDKRILPKNKRD